MTRSISAFRNKELLAERSANAFPIEVRQLIRVMRVGRAEPKVVGSFRFRLFEYPSDIDMMEFLPRSTSSAKLATNFQNCVRRIHANRRLFITDIKAGVDPRYEIRGLGTVKNGRLVKFERASLQAQIYRLRKHNLLTLDEARLMNACLRKIKPRQPLSRVPFVRLIRKFYILRWTPDEVMRGFKRRRDGLNISLVDAITKYRTRIKIDAVALLGDHRLVEFSNIPVAPRVTITPKHYRRSVLNEINTFLKTSSNWLKLAKRTWLLAAQSKSYVALRPLSKLFRGPIGKLGQIKTDMETLQLLEQKVDPGPVVRRKAIGSVKQRIAGIPPTLIHDQTLSWFITQLTKLEVQKLKTSSYRRVLSTLIDTLSNIIDIYVKGYLERSGILKYIRNMLKRRKSAFESVPEKCVLLGV